MRRGTFELCIYRLSFLFVLSREAQCCFRGDDDATESMEFILKLSGEMRALARRSRNKFNQA